MSRNLRRKPSLRVRLTQLEAAVAQIGESISSLQGEIAERAPASEIERLNHAIELIAERAPASEIERLNHAFELIAERAPASEIERLNHAFELIAERAPASEIERLDHAIELIAERAPASEIERLDHAIELIAERAPASEIERLDHAFELIRQSERVVEVPWVLGKYRGEARVLEVGYAFAEEHYLRGLLELDIPFLVGVDAALSPRSPDLLAFHRVQGDLLHDCLRAKSFDLVLCVSTIEHVGRDNTRYGLDDGREESAPDLIAMRNLARWVAPGGRLLITVPFGRFEDHGWLINYDMEHLEALIEVSGLTPGETRFFGWQPGVWQEVEPAKLAGRGYGSFGATHASGVALIELLRPANKP